MSARALIATALVVCVGFFVSVASQAEALPGHLVSIASRSVVAANSSGKLSTAFGFSHAGIIVVGTTTQSSVRLITNTGAEATGQVQHLEGRLATVAVSGIDLVPLRSSGARQINPGTPTYVMGSPLGYNPDRIRYVHLPAFTLATTGLLSVPGSLPAAFLGAPIVTQGGRLVGAVASVGAGAWKFAPLGRLQALVAAGSSTEGSGVPILSIVGGAVLVFLAGVAFAMLHSRNRRRRAAEEAEMARRRAGATPATEPLVVLRTPEPEPDDDFDVIVKSQDEP